MLKKIFKLQSHICYIITNKITLLSNCYYFSTLLYFVHSELDTHFEIHDF